MVARTWWALLLACLACVPIVYSYTEVLDQETDSWIRCGGMYALSAIPGASGEGTINLRFDYVSTASNLNILIYDSRDQELLEDPDTHRMVICGAGDTITSGNCSAENKGKFMVRNTRPPTSSILNELYHFDGVYANKTGSAVVKYSYQVNITGFYCVAAVSMADSTFLATVEWDNPYGLLPAIEYPKLPFYGLLSITFMIIGIVWMVLSFKHSGELLPIQLWTTGVTLFIVTEMAFNYGFYEDWNRIGRPSIFLLVLVVILNAARNSLSFFMLLVVSLGYGVVKPTLGTTMHRCIGLGCLHFVCGVMYMMGSQVLSDITAVTILIFVLPLAATMTAFYFWILTALTETMKRLELRRQSVKLEMYRNLWRLLSASVVVLVIFFIVNTFNVSYRESPNWMPHYWQWRWFLLEGWLNILYLFVYIGILILWRPTANNSRYGLEQISSEDDDEEALGKGGGLWSNGRVKLRQTKSDTNLDDDEEEDDDDVLQWVEKNVASEKLTNGESSSNPKPLVDVHVDPAEAALLAEEASKKL
ncbi:hypothetical protein SmJEL517_g02519 [Synchytrium microbalum]|uniref:Intimal thickness related receptor IRP domain-containing protein n=1 Tax=Synchytrium microbalum TaxID=1806994 RepID=A0A507CBS1_9FUNG|nr:uncharacterized protein SmJEL517_g02519 [Synchytrium microbalum]TPX35005.1 hypothetical protein SmJEL517_g02519 [Synchytrium microbalum]